MHRRRGCSNALEVRSGKVWKATKDQRISTQVWRIPCEKISINAVSERLAGRETTCLQQYERFARLKSTVECPDVQTINTEYRSRLSSVVFQSENHSWNKSQAEIVLGRTIPSIEVDSSSLGGDQTSVLSRRREIGEPGLVEAIPCGRCDSPGSWGYRPWPMVRQRRVDRATRGTSGRGGDEILRTVHRPERPRDTSLTRPIDSSYPWRSWGDSCKRRNTWKNTGGDPWWRQGGGDRGGRNARGSWADDGRSMSGQLLKELSNRR